MKSNQAILSEKGQVTIPNKIRHIMGLKSGEILEFEAAKGELIIRKKKQGKTLDEVVGILKGKVKSVDDYLDDIRGSR